MGGDFPAGVLHPLGYLGLPALALISCVIISIGLGVFVWCLLSRAPSVTQNDRSTTPPAVNKSWETFKSNLHGLFKKLPGASDIDSNLILKFKETYDYMLANFGRTYETCKKGREEACREKLQSLMESFMLQLTSMQLWSEENGFQTDSSRVFFFLVANQLYRAGGKCDICPLCGIRKKYRRNNKDEGDPDSHIFPKSLLNIFSKVHCEGAGNFIWDMALSDKYGAGKLAVKLLCQKCELSASHAEEKLQDLYLYILSHPNERIKVPNEEEWLSFVFANIMFRGLVINVNLMNEICRGQFGSVEALLDLRRYCMKPVRENLPPLYLSVLPNGPFNPELGGATYMFDLQLRNPEFTSIVDMEEGTFLYTKFDCFHCMLPLVDRSLSFGTVLDSGKKTIPSEGERCCQFPKVLLRRNLDKAAELFTYIISQSQPDLRLDYHCKVFISRVCSICHRSETIQWPTTGIQLYSETSHCQFKVLKKGEREQKIEEAAQASPLKTIRIGSSPLVQENTLNRKRIRQLQSKFDTQKNQLKEARENVDKREIQVADVQKERDELQEQLAQQEQECHGLKAELERKDIELERKDAELEKLKHQLNIMAQKEPEGLVTHEITAKKSST